MGCDCKEKLIAKAQGDKCPDADEESYRIAFLNESKKFTRIQAERSELEKQLVFTVKTSQNKIDKLYRELQSLENYLMRLIHELSDDERNRVIRLCGNPPLQARTGE